MLRAHAVAQFHIVLVTGPATVGVIRAFGKKSAEHTMLHVKHGHVLMDGDLKPLRRGAFQQRLELLIFKS